MPRMKEHEDAYKKGMTKKSAITKHAWTTNHNIEWSETTYTVGPGKGRKELMIKEAMHVSLTPEVQHFKKDVSVSFLFLKL